MKELEIYRAKSLKIQAFGYALSLINWDAETEEPHDASAVRIERMSQLYQALYELETEKTYLDLINKIFENRANLEPKIAREITLAYKGIRLLRLVPKNEYLDYINLVESATIAWRKAKDQNNFSIFAPYLEDIIVYQRKLCGYLETPDIKGYDVLLDLYSEGTNQKLYDSLFKLLKEEIGPLVLNKGLAINRILGTGHFEIAKQKQLSLYIAKTIGLDFNKTVLKESVHPFTTTISPTDVRITTKYYEHDLCLALFSTVHESGHAMLEQNISFEYHNTGLSEITDMALHESQSRFYENHIGKNPAFWVKQFPKLQELFPKDLETVSYDDFISYINMAQRSKIRIDADELTYPFHIIIRYEIEKKLFLGELTVSQLPDYWNKLYKSYLGVSIDNDAQGVLQDIHWSNGSFGYFPTYVLGSAYAAQLYFALSRQIDIAKDLQEGNFEAINSWLNDNVRTHGSFKTATEIIKAATKEEFNPKYYIGYLKEKYR